MKKENIFLVGVLALAGYLIWKNSKKMTLQEPAPSPEASESVKVEVMEPEAPQSEKLSANAAVTQPPFASSVFRRDWVIGNQNSPFN